MVASRVPLVSVLVDGSALDAAAVTRVRVEQSLSLPDRVTVHLRDPGFELAGGSALSIGAALDVSIDTGDGGVAVAWAEVTEIGCEVAPDERHETVVVALDRGHRLSHGTKVRTFTGMTDRAIVQKIAGEHGLRAKAEGSGPAHEYLLQYGSDYAFLDERATALGHEWWVEDETLHFGPLAASKGPELEFGRNLRSFKLQVSGTETAADVTVQGWDPVAHKTVSETARIPALAPAEGVGTDAPLAKDLVADAAKAKALKTNHFTGVEGVATAAEARELAKSLAHRAAAEQVRARGEAIGDPNLRAGAQLTVKGVGTRLEGRYLLTDVTHHWTADGYGTTFVAGGREDRGLHALLGGRRQADEAAFGRLVVGVVTNRKDPKKLGRVKVKYPTLSDKDESNWARVVSVGAGKTRGLMVVPDLGDEVLLGFEHGDPRRPLVLGGLWSGKQKRPELTDAATDLGGMWRTKAGHTVELSDGKGAANRFVNVSLADGKTELRIAEDGVTLTTPNGLELTADKGGKITIKGRFNIIADNVTVAARQKLVLKGDRGVDISGGMGPVKVQGASVEVAGRAQTSLGGGSPTMVKGTPVKLG